MLLVITATRTPFRVSAVTLFEAPRPRNWPSRRFGRLRRGWKLEGDDAFAGPSCALRGCVDPVEARRQGGGAVLVAHGIALSYPEVFLHHKWR